MGIDWDFFCLKDTILELFQQRTSQCPWVLIGSIINEVPIGMFLKNYPWLLQVLSWLMLIHPWLPDRKAWPEMLNIILVTFITDRKPDKYFMKMPLSTKTTVSLRSGTEIKCPFTDKSLNRERKDLGWGMLWMLPKGFSLTPLKNWIIDPEQKDLRNTQVVFIRNRYFIFQTSQVTENSALSCSELPSYKST